MHPHNPSFGAWRLGLADALRQMLRYKTQSALAVLGVGIGVANIVLLLGMTDLGRRQAMGLLEDFGARLVIVTPFIDTGGPMGVFSQASGSGFIPQSVLDVLRGCDVLADSGLEAPGESRVISGMLRTAAHVSRGESHYNAIIAGSTLQVTEFSGTKLAQGRWMSPLEAAGVDRVAVLGARVKEAIFGAGDALGQSISIKGEQFLVIGVNAPKPSRGMEEMDTRVFIPLPVAQELFGIAGVHGILARYRAGLSDDQAVDEVRRFLKGSPAGAALDESVCIWTVREASKLMDNTLSVFRKVLLGVGSIALVVAGMGILNVMLLRVMQRRVEIGIRRASGATSGVIGRQFLIESLVQAGLGALLGLLLGLGGLLAYCRYSDWSFYIGLRTLLLAPGFGLACGAFAGAYPALRAARLDPIACLRAEM